MNIGIVTCHRSHNYGAVLQAFALKTYLSKRGHNVDFADILPSYFNNDYEVPRKSFFKSSLKEKLLYFKYLYKWWWPKYKLVSCRSKNFRNFISKYLIKDKKDYNKQFFDLLIYGSDQIWSKEPLEDGTVYFDPIFWGDETLHASKKITYSASMGVLRILPDDHLFIKEKLQNFDKVAVREFDLYNYLIDNNLIDKSKIYFTIDPVFLLNIEDWKKLIKKRIIREPYLLFYDFQIDETTTKIVKEIAKNKNLKIIRITDGVVSLEKEQDYMPTAGPLEFLSLIYYSDFVVSSSFHGTAFSIVFKKQFVVRQVWNKDRVKTLLQRLGLSERFIDRKDFNDMLTINYDDVNNKLKYIVKQSREYLNSI